MLWHLFLLRMRILSNPEMFSLSIACRILFVMMKIFLVVTICLLSSLTYACKINWKRLPQKVPSFAEKVRPQGLTVFKNKLVLTNHFKDTPTSGPSELAFLDIENFAVEKKFYFPKDFSHVGGLASDEHYIYASDFDNQDLLRIDVDASFSSNALVSKKIMTLAAAGASGLSVSKGLLAVSYYIVPHRSPYFSDRLVQFYDLTSGKRVSFEGKILGSNFSQGLTFINHKSKLYLIEAINVFSSVMRYWLTGLDDAPDLIRVYAVDIAAKKITHLKDDLIPSLMVEDLAFDGDKYLYTTDEQDFHFYRGTFQSDCLLESGTDKNAKSI